MEEKGKNSINESITRVEPKDMEKQAICLLESVTGKLGAGVLLIDRKYHVMWANQVLKGQREIENKVCYSAVHNKPLCCPDCGAKKIFEEKTEMDIRECTTLDDYGNQIWTELIVTPVRDMSGTIIGALELELPITKHKKVEQALQESEEKFRAISNSLIDAVILVDSEGKIAYCNPSAEKIFGYSTDEAIGMKENALFSLPTHEHNLRERENGTTKKPFETYGTRRDGLEVPIEISTTQIQFGGKNYGFYIARDITEQKRLQKKLSDYSQHLKSMIEIRTMQLKDANERLLKTERLAAIGELAGMVGHDLRNPLAGMRGAVYYLKTKFGSCLSEDGLKMLKTIDDCISYSDKIINDLLDYSRVIRIEPSETTPELMLKIALSHLQIPDKIILSNDVENEPSLKVDNEKMTRVFVNLIKNACDAMPEGGNLKISSQKAKNRVIFYFEDTGIGMSRDTLSKIWTPLFTTKAKGMGFGLAICKRIIEAHGGTIVMESTFGKGTKVTVNIPVNPPANEGTDTWVANQKQLSIIKQT